jgi:hypothetical protein
MVPRVKHEEKVWIPAFAGMTRVLGVALSLNLMAVRRARVTGIAG